VDLHKIAGLLAIVLAIVGCFVVVPFAASALLVLGIVAAWVIEADVHVRVLASTLVLSMAGGPLGDLAFAGPILADLVGGLTYFAVGCSTLIILRNLYLRYKPF
jgi:hypothetical protein